MRYAFNLLGVWPTDGWWRLLWPTLEGAVWALFLFSYTAAVSGSASPVLNSFLNTAVLVLPLTLFFSAISYHAIKRPFLRLRVKYLSPIAGKESAT